MMETRIVLHDMQASGEMRPEQGKGPTFFRDGSWGKLMDVDVDGFVFAIEYQLHTRIE